MVIRHSPMGLCGVHCSIINRRRRRWLRPARPLTPRIPRRRDLVARRVSNPMDSRTYRAYLASVLQLVEAPVTEPAIEDVAHGFLAEPVDIGNSV